MLALIYSSLLSNPEMDLAFSLNKLVSEETYVSILEPGLSTSSNKTISYFIDSTISST